MNEEYTPLDEVLREAGYTLEELEVEETDPYDLADLAPALAREVSVLRAKLRSQSDGGPSEALAITRVEFAGKRRELPSDEVRAARLDAHMQRFKAGELKLELARAKRRLEFLEITLKAENDRVERNDFLEHHNQILREQNAALRRDLRAEGLRVQGVKKFASFALEILKFGAVNATSPRELTDAMNQAIRKLEEGVGECLSI